MLEILVDGRRRTVEILMGGGEGGLDSKILNQGSFSTKPVMSTVSEFKELFKKFVGVQKFKKSLSQIWQMM